MNINRIANPSSPTNAPSEDLAPTSSIFSLPNPNTSNHILSTPGTSAFASQPISTLGLIDRQYSRETSDYEDSRRDTRQPTPLTTSMSTSDIPYLLNSASGHRRISQFQVSSPLPPAGPRISRTSTAPNPKQPVQPKPLSLGEFLYKKGFLGGLASDVTIVCFGHEYHLHKLILSRSSFFASLVSSTWTDDSDNHSPSKSRVHEIDFSHDENVTRQSFELALARLYGHADPAKEKDHITELLAVASFLDMPDIVVYCVAEIVKSIGRANIAPLLYFSSKFEYGEASSQIVESCKTYLFTEGYDLSREVWAEIPNDIAAEVVAADAFYVPTEWDRVQFMVLLYRHKVNKLLSSREGGKSTSRRLTRAQAEELQPLRDALNFKIHYCHLTYAQLEMLENLRDNRGQLLIRRESLRNALWLQTGLRHKVVNASIDDEDLGLIRSIPGKRAKGKGKNKRNDPAEIEGSDEDVSGGTSSSASPKGKSRADSSDEGGSKRLVGGEDKIFSQDESDHESNSETDEDNDQFESSDDEDGIFTYYPIPCDAEGLDSEESKSNVDQRTTMTKFPPFRFSVKFEDIMKLKVEKRVYSNNFWYAGSYWNVYIQKVPHKRGYQLGVYLHRAKLDATAQSSNLTLEQQLSLFDLNDDDTQAPQLTTASTASPLQRRSQSLFLDAHGPSSFNISTSTATGRDGQEISLDALPWDLQTDNGSSLLDTAVTWPDTADTTTQDTTRGPFSTQSRFPYVDQALGLEPNISPSRNTQPILEWAPRSPQFTDTALAAALAAEAAAQGTTIDMPSMLTSTNAGSSSATGNTGASGLGSLLRKPGGGSKPEYLDTRRGIKAYFEIYTPPRRKGGQLNCFSSSPDIFRFAQSWGWKSSTLCGTEETSKGGRPSREEAQSAKFMIVIGLV